MEIYISDKICTLRDGGKKSKKKKCVPLGKSKGKVMSPKNVDKSSNNKGKSVAEGNGKGKGKGKTMVEEKGKDKSIVVENR